MMSDGYPDVPDQSSDEEHQEGFGSPEKSDALKRVLDLPVDPFFEPDFCIDDRLDERVHQRPDDRNRYHGKVCDVGHRKDSGDDGDTGEADPEQDKGIDVFICDPVENRPEPGLPVCFSCHAPVHEVENSGNEQEQRSEQEQPVCITYRTGETGQQG